MVAGQLRSVGLLAVKIAQNMLGYDIPWIRDNMAPPAKDLENLDFFVDEKGTTTGFNREHRERQAVEYWQIFENRAAVSWRLGPCSRGKNG